MSVATELGQNGRETVYVVSDNELAVGSTLGGPKVATNIKANGAIETVYAVEDGQSLFGTICLRHYDVATGMHLSPVPHGSFRIHPEFQEHLYSLPNGISVHERIFILNGNPADGADPPAVYLDVQYTNLTKNDQKIAGYVFAELRGNTEHDVECRFDDANHTFVAWNTSKPEMTRVFGASVAPTSYETTLDMGKAVAGRSPGMLAGTTTAPTHPMAVFHHEHALTAGGTKRLYYLASFGKGSDDATVQFKRCPTAEDALTQTSAYYRDMLNRSVVLTPNPQVNSGVLWAKANMIRVMVKSQTGWCFVNDPTRSNNSVGRDTAWFAYGGDYFAPEFVEESLMAYVNNMEDSGKVVEYYDIRNGKTADYNLNINDDTPLLVLALWHHYYTSGNQKFLETIYPAAVKAVRYILSQRNEQGLVWCDATGTSDWGIIGWRNVIEDYRLSGATTEVNSECFAALQTVSHMARVLEKHDASAEFAREADALKLAINTHLYNHANGLYYLNIDVDGEPRSDVTSDLVFPVMFGVADEETSARIVGRLSDNDFWTVSGMRTTPRDAPNYSPKNGWGLLGGVWVGVSFWYAFAASRYSPEFMDHALSSSFRNFSMDPRRNNTVPGQFSEWLHGETLVNEGMMLSPWDPPRYLWAAIEGAGGLDLRGTQPNVQPRLASDWKWMGVQNLPFRGERLTWFVVRLPEVTLYANFHPHSSESCRSFAEDITDSISSGLDSVVTIGLREDDTLLILAGNTSMQTATTSVAIECELAGSYRAKLFDSLLGRWAEIGLISAEQLKIGHVMQIEHRGFCLLELQQEV